MRTIPFLSSNSTDSTPREGVALPRALRHEVETRLSQDFSEVRVHVGNAATLLGAQAFTQGTNIHFAPGQYNPFSSDGRNLLAHELTHIIQQRAGAVQPIAEGLVAVSDEGTSINTESTGEGE